MELRPPAAHSASGPGSPARTASSCAANARGDAIDGNFELQFSAEAPFSFPGGGLIIRFSSPSPAYQLDTTLPATDDWKVKKRKRR